MRYSILITVLCLVFLPSLLSAEVPLYINYQGRLTDSLGIPVPDGDYTILFSIWDSETEGDMLWGNDINVTVEDGLFTCQLGQLPDGIFANNADRWLSIEIAGRMDELLPRSKITSGAYAFHALRADTARYVTGGDNCGWIRDSRGVKLAVPGDSVGIGTAAPSAKLEVEGDIKTSDSLIASHVKAGSMSEPGKITVYKNGLADPLAKLVQYEPIGGGALHIFQNDPNTSVLRLEPDYEGTGAYLSLCKNSYDVGFFVDGNYHIGGEPRVGILGSERSAIFNMNVSGDDAVTLPFSSISSSEIYNEAGVANSVLSSVVGIGSTPTTILTRQMWFPTSGYVAVIATASYNFWHAFGTIDQLRFGISKTQGIFPADQDHYRDYPSSWSGFNFKDNVTVHDYYIVDAGLNTFYFLGEHIGSPPGATVVDANLTVMFFPTWRGYIIIPPGSDEAASANPEQYERDRLIMEKIEEEKEALRQEFDAKLEEIKTELQKQMGTIQ